MSNWWSGRYQVERKCTCASRSAECLQLGWHVVGSSDNLGSALAETRQLAEEIPTVPYRTLEASNRQVIETLCF